MKAKKITRQSTITNGNTTYKIKSTNKTHLGNTVGFIVYVNGKRFDIAKLERRVAEDKALGRYIGGPEFDAMVKAEEKEKADRASKTTEAVAGQRVGYDEVAKIQIEYLKSSYGGEDLKKVLSAGYGLLAAMVNDSKPHAFDRSTDVAHIQLQLREAMEYYSRAMTEAGC
jgi:hypothetical protein